jgi:RHS repeat-associated protein
MQPKRSLINHGAAQTSGMRMLMDASRIVTDRWDYDAFGGVTDHTGTTNNDFTYRGEQNDGLLGLQHLGPRWMNPTTGRFLQADPASGAAGHLYVYGLDNPIDFADPTGFASAASIGTSVHSALGEYFEQTDPENRFYNRTVYNLLRKPKSALQAFLGNLCFQCRPDLADSREKSIWEIKPQGHLAEGLSDVDYYLDLLLGPVGSGWHAAKQEQFAQLPLDLPVAFDLNAPPTIVHFQRSLGGVILYDYPGRKRRERDYEVWEVDRALEDERQDRDSIDRALGGGIGLPIGGYSGGVLTPEVMLLVP